MSSKTAILAHYQPADGQRHTHVTQDVANFLVNRMVCERISQKVIRMFPPESVFAAVKFSPEVQKYIPDDMPGGEIPGVYFKEPASDPASNIPRMRNLPRYRPVYGEAQLAASV